jgi:hypothetical protein
VTDRKLLDFRSPLTRWEWTGAAIGFVAMYFFEPMIEDAILAAHFEGAMVAWLRGALGATIGIMACRLARK